MSRASSPSSGKSSYNNTTPIDEFIKDGRSKVPTIDVKHIENVMEENWVENVGDIRLLHKEGELKNLSLPKAFIDWIVKECLKDFSEADKKKISLLVFYFSFFVFFGPAAKFAKFFPFLAARKKRVKY